MAISPEYLFRNEIGKWPAVSSGTGVTYIGLPGALISPLEISGGE
jgi:hypothetical protein